MSTHKFSAQDLPDMTGRTVVVTGANSGIGKIAAGELAAHGARVILAVRDVEKGEAAAASMDGDTEVRQIDLSDQESVHAFAEGIDEEIDVLINNAGIMAVPLQRTPQGFEWQFGTNHLGHFTLTNLLLPQITDRVVVLSSTAHEIGKIDLDDLNFEHRRYTRWGAYGQSKLANLMFAYELQRKFQAAGSDLRAYACHPGYASTNLQSHTGSTLQNAVMWVGNHTIAHNAEMGALPTLLAATGDEPAGSYIGPDGFRQMRGHPKVVRSTKDSHDPVVAARLWELSEELTGVSFPLTAVPA
jgi:NAD(P)-dependent dehydrogenase (short-subunit alcohol dehydrogenase family)